MNWLWRGNDFKVTQAGFDPKRRDDLVINAMDLGGEVLVELGAAVAGDDIAIGSAADRCLLSGGNTDIPFRGRQLTRRRHEPGAKTVGLAAPRAALRGPSCAIPA
jgi:hypothetical protein